MIANSVIMFCPDYVAMRAFKEVHPKWKRNSVDSVNLTNHRRCQFKDPFCVPCLPGTILASLPLTQEVASSSVFYLTWMTYSGGSSIPEIMFRK